MSFIVTYVGSCARCRDPKITRTHCLFSRNSNLLEAKTRKQSYIRIERLIFAFLEFITKDSNELNNPEQFSFNSYKGS